ncbi:MAG: hypothetical protein GY772_16430 [bacterium]|nr:hypothetical protein [bacterium]
MTVAHDSKDKKILQAVMTEACAETAAKGALFEQVRHAQDADIIVVPDITRDFYGVAALKARLWGRRLADSEWLASAGKAGRILAFRAWRANCHAIVYLSSAIDTKYRKAFVRAAATAPVMPGSREARLIVHDNIMDASGPSDAEVTRHPRLTWLVVATDVELKAVERAREGRPPLQIATLRTMTDRVTSLYGPARVD